MLIALRVLWHFIKRAFRRRPREEQIPFYGWLSVGDISAPIDRVVLRNRQLTFYATAGTTQSGRMDGWWEIRGEDGSLLWRSSGGRNFGVKTVGSTWKLDYSVNMEKATGVETR